MKCRYRVQGTDAHGVGFTVQGEVDAQGIVDPETMHAVGAEVFDKLTQGDAMYGHPGAGGCRGPYRIARVVIERSEDIQ